MDLEQEDDAAAFFGVRIEKTMLFLDMKQDCLINHMIKSHDVEANEDSLWFAQCL